jgi:[acyl-carrier-protein] S-malonyltransferase
VLAKEQGAKRAQLLPVSVPSHCALMSDAAVALRSQLDNIDMKTPEVPVIQNAGVASFDAVDDIRLGLAKQLYSPVRWVETVQFFAANSVQNVVECGPGKVLMGLGKRIDKSLKHATIFDVKTLGTTLEALS